MVRRRIGKGKARIQAATHKAALQPPFLSWMAKRADPQPQSPFLSRLPWEIRSQILSYVFGSGARIIRGSCRRGDHHDEPRSRHGGHENFLRKEGTKWQDICGLGIWEWWCVGSDQWRCADQALPTGEEGDGIWEEATMWKGKGIMGLLLVCRLLHLDIISYLRTLPFIFTDLSLACEFFSGTLIGPSIPVHIVRHVHIESSLGFHMSYLYTRAPSRRRAVLASGQKQLIMPTVFLFEERYDTLRSRTQAETRSWESLWPAFLSRGISSSVQDVRICFHHRNERTKEWGFVDEKRLLAPLTNLRSPSSSSSSSSSAAARTPKPGAPSTLNLGDELLAKTTICLPPLREDVKDPNKHFLDGNRISFRRLVRCGRETRTKWRDVDDRPGKKTMDKRRRNDRTWVCTFDAGGSDSDSDSSSEANSGEEVHAGEPSTLLHESPGGEWETSHSEEEEAEFSESDNSEISDISMTCEVFKLDERGNMLA